MAAAAVACQCCPLPAGKGSLPCMTTVLNEKTDKKRRRRLRSVLSTFSTATPQPEEQELWLASLAGLLSGLAISDRPSGGDKKWQLADIVEELTVCGATCAFSKMLVSTSESAVAAAAECLSFLFRARENAEYFVHSIYLLPLLELLKDRPLTVKLHAAAALSTAIATAWDTQGLALEALLSTDGTNLSPLSTILPALMSLARTDEEAVRIEAKGPSRPLVIAYIFRNWDDRMRKFEGRFEEAVEALAPTIAKAAREVAWGCLARLLAACCRSADCKRQLLAQHGKLLVPLLVTELEQSLEGAAPEDAAIAAVVASCLACLCYQPFPFWQERTVQQDELMHEAEDDFVLVEMGQGLNDADFVVVGEDPPPSPKTPRGGSLASSAVLEDVAVRLSLAAEKAVTDLQRRSLLMSAGAAESATWRALQATAARLLDSLANLTHAPAAAEKLTAVAPRLAALATSAAELAAAAQTSPLQRALCTLDSTQAFFSSTPVSETAPPELPCTDRGVVLPFSPATRKPGQRFGHTAEVLHHSPTPFMSLLICIANIALVTSPALLPACFGPAALKQVDVARQRGNEALSSGNHGYARCWYNAALRLAHCASAQEGVVYSSRHLLWSNRAEACLRGGQFSAALADVEQALALEPSHTKSALRKERALYSLGLLAVGKENGQP